MIDKNEEFYCEISEFLKISEVIFKNDVLRLKKKLKNLKKINVESFVKLIQQEINDGHLKDKYDIFNYIEDIITD